MDVGRVQDQLFISPAPSGAEVCRRRIDLQGRLPPLAMDLGPAEANAIVHFPICCGVILTSGMPR